METMGYVLLFYSFIERKRIKFRYFLDGFVISFCILMMTAFLPRFIATYPLLAPRTYLDYIKEWFYYIWCGLTIIIFFVYKPFKLA